MYFIVSFTQRRYCYVGLHLYVRKDVPGCLSSSHKPQGKDVFLAPFADRHNLQHFFDSRPCVPSAPYAPPHPRPSLSPSHLPALPHTPALLSSTPRWPLTHFGLVLVRGVEVRIVSVEDYPVVVEENVSHPEGLRRRCSWMTFGGKRVSE